MGLLYKVSISAHSASRRRMAAIVEVRFPFRMVRIEESSWLMLDRALLFVVVFFFFLLFSILNIRDRTEDAVRPSFPGRVLL